MSETLGLAKLRRVVTMSPHELLTRSRQLAWKGAGRLGLRFREHSSVPQVTGRLLVPAVSDFRETARVARQLDPKGSAEIVARADAICEGQFEILGFGSISFGQPVDWHLDPINSRRSPLLHFSRIDPLDARVVGDHKIVWELNRHAFLITLAQAHALTGEDRYLVRAAQLLREWLERNPPEVGVNWVSSLEVAFRALAWAYVWPLFRSSPRFGPALCSDWLASVSAHARHIARYTSHYFAPNTHLTGEGLALYLLGLTFPELTGTRRHRRLGRRILDAEFARQLRADGLHYEQSACYHRYTLEFLLLDYLATAVCTFDVTHGARERLEGSVDAMLPLVQPNGLLVNVGDEDGGQLLRLGTRDPLDARPLLAACAVLLCRSDLKAIVGALPAEVLWIMGPNAVRQWETLPSTDPPAPSQALPSSGYVAMRDAWGASGDHVLFDAGPHGAERCRFGHAHADPLSIALSIGGVPFIVDPGTGSYVHTPTRESLRSTFSHSTAWVDDESPCAPGKAFEWLSAANGTLRQWKSTTEFDFAEGVHDGHRNASRPVMHRRRVLYWRRRGWLLWDLFDGEGERRVSVQFVLAAQPSTVVVNDSTVLAPTGALCLFPRSGARIVDSRVAPIRVSPRYGAFVSAAAFRSVVEAQLPTAIVTLIRPRGRPHIRPPNGGIPDGGNETPGTDCAFQDDATGDLVLVRDSDAGPPSGGKRLRSDATVTWVSQRSDEILVVGGRSVMVDNQTVLQADQLGDWIVARGVTRSLEPTDQFAV